MNLTEIYTERHENALVLLAIQLEADLREYFDGVKRIDRITARAKSVDRFIAKAEKLDEKTGQKKYNNPLREIQDQVGARIVTFYLSDVEAIEKIILKYYKPIEIQSIVPDSDSKFGYIGSHFILHFPPDVELEGVDKSLVPDFFELQIKTLFQHAWAEANHDLAYKSSKPLTNEQNRKIAFTAAQAWGADMIFEQLQAELLGGVAKN